MNTKATKSLVKNPLGYWEVEHKPTEAELQDYYSQKYYQETKGSYEAQYSEAEIQYFRTKIHQRWSVIAKLVAGTGSLLDVGCGEGYTLSFFRELGWQVKGLDYSSAGLASKNPHCIDVLCTGNVFQLIREESAAGNTYDVIWLQNVLEHVIDPVHLMVSLQSIIKPAGVLVVTVPNDFSAIQITALDRGHIDSEFWVALPDHLSYFSRDSLQSLGFATGWSCAETIADFPIDWYLYHRGSNYVKDRALGKAAHYARVELENLIGSRPVDDVINFYSALARIGMGRDLTSFYRALKPER